MSELPADLLTVSHAPNPGAEAAPPTGEIPLGDIHSPGGIYSLTWTEGTRFYLLRHGNAGSRVEVEGVASDEAVPATVVAACITDLGSFALALRVAAPQAVQQTAFFVAGPDGYRRMRGLWSAGAVSLGLAASGSWLAIQAAICPGAAEDGLLHLFNTAEGKLLWAVPSETGFDAVTYRFDDVAGLVYVQTAGGEFPYHLPDGRFDSQKLYRLRVLEHGTPSQLRDLARREFQLLGPAIDLSPARRRAAAKSIFQLLTLAAQRGPDWAPAFAALGEFFDWLPDPTKAARCHARASQIRAAM